LLDTTTTNNIIRAGFQAKAPADAKSQASLHLLRVQHHVFRCRSEINDFPWRIARAEQTGLPFQRVSDTSVVSQCSSCSGLSGSLSLRMGSRHPSTPMTNTRHHQLKPAKWACHPRLNAATPHPSSHLSFRFQTISFGQHLFVGLVRGDKNHSSSSSACVCHALAHLPSCPALVIAATSSAWRRDVCAANQRAPETDGSPG